MLAAAFIVVQGLVLTFAPAARERSWEVQFRWSHWLGIAIWLAVFITGPRLLERHLPVRDKLVLPLCSLLGGLGLVSIWRLEPQFGFRQAIWLVVSAAARGLGVGSQLMKAAETLLREAGCVEISVTTLPDNLRAIEFYRAHGLTDEAVYLEKHLED